MQTENVLQSATICSRVAISDSADTYDTMKNESWQKRMRRHLERRHWNANTAAKLSGVGYTTIRNWLEEETDGSFATVVTVALAIDMDLYELAGVSPPESVRRASPQEAVALLQRAVDLLSRPPQSSPGE